MLILKVLCTQEEVAKSQKEAFLRSTSQLESTIVDVITQNSIGTITEFTLLPISKIITRLRQTQPLDEWLLIWNYSN